MSQALKCPRFKLQGAHGISAEYDDEKLIIRVDRKKRSELRRMRRQDSDYFQTDRTLYDFLEPLTCNSELEWCSADDTGDLTSAPMLCIQGWPQTSRSGPYGVKHVGRWENSHGQLRDWYQPIQFRWGFEPYALRSPLDDLADSGEVVFTNHW